MSYTAYDLRSQGQVRTDNRRPAMRRSYRTIVIALMVVTTCFALYDLYLFALSGLH